MDLIKINDAVDDLMTDLTFPEESGVLYKTRAGGLLKIKDVIMRMILPAIPPEASVLETFYSDFYRILGSSVTVHKKTEELLGLKKKMNAMGGPLICGTVEDILDFYDIFQIRLQAHEDVNGRDLAHLITSESDGEKIKELIREMMETVMTGSGKTIPPEASGSKENVCNGENCRWVMMHLAYYFMESAVLFYRTSVYPDLPSIKEGNRKDHYQKILETYSKEEVKTYAAEYLETAACLLDAVYGWMPV